MVTCQVSIQLNEKDIANANDTYLSDLADHFNENDIQMPRCTGTMIETVLIKHGGKTTHPRLALAGGRSQLNTEPPNQTREELFFCG